MKSLDDIFKEFSEELLKQRKEIPFMFNAVEIRQEEISQGRLATYDKNVGWNAALEWVAKEENQEKLKASLQTLLASHEVRGEESDLKNAIEELDILMREEGRRIGDEWVTDYLIPAGRWHKILAYARGAKEPHPSPEPSGERCKCNHVKGSHSGIPPYRCCIDCPCSNFRPSKNKKD